MNKVLSKINTVVNRVFKNDILITEDMKLSDVKGVNSLNIVLLLVEIEKTFSVEFPYDFEPVTFSDILIYLSISDE